MPVGHVVALGAKDVSQPVASNQTVTGQAKYALVNKRIGGKEERGFSKAQ
jgi:hypothetical protein